MSRTWWLAIGGGLLAILLLGVCLLGALVFLSQRGGALFDRSSTASEGVYLVLAAEFGQAPAGERVTTLEAARTIIQRRAEGYGVSRAVVKREGDDRVAVWFPGLRTVQP